MAFDLDQSRAEAFGRNVVSFRADAEFSVARNLEEVLSVCEMVAFGTTAIVPHVKSLDACPDGVTILHVSLRDLDADVILANHNIVDDLDHVNRAATSIHLASQQAGNTEFVHGSFGDILLGRVPLPEDDKRKIVFSPFGLGILDLAVADLMLSTMDATGGGTRVKSFLP